MWLRERKDREDNNYGPEYGIDYARFSDTPNLAADNKLRDEVSLELKKTFPEEFETITIFVKNGFVFLKGDVADSSLRLEIAEKVSHVHSVQEVVNQLFARNVH